MLLEKQKLIGNQWAQIAKEIPGRTENQVKNRFNSMLKKIREEKTFKSEVKAGVHEALQQMDQTTDNKIQMEEQWIDELIERKKIDVANMPEEEDEEEKSEGIEGSNYQTTNNAAQADIKMEEEQLGHKIDLSKAYQS